MVGTGFSTSFFLWGYLNKAKPGVRILVLERGNWDSHTWQIDNMRTSSLDPLTTFVNKNPSKPWEYSPGFGGGSNIWWACTPRMMPSDFRLKSLYGVGVDWPLDYNDLEEFYYQVEVAMAVSGPDDGSPYPRSNPYPQPPHLFSDPDKLLKRAYPDKYFQQPCARTAVSTANRDQCCAAGVCGICPVDAKFTILNEMAYLYRDSRVKLLLGAEALTVETRGNIATGVTYSQDKKIKFAKGDLVILGANSIFNPFILLRSGLHHPKLGKFWHEQVSIFAAVDLKGVDNYQGSTAITGHGYMLYDGDHRANYSACLIESLNIPNLFTLRAERGKWLQRMVLRFIYEDIPNEKNHVKISDDNPDLPATVYEGHSEYASRALDKLPSILPGLLGSLPVENIEISKKIRATDGHIIGTTRMGTDSRDSIVDRYLIHHKIRNLIVLGSCTFPTSSPANPALTLSALSLWSANHLLH